MKKANKTLAIVVALAIMIGLFSISASAATSTEVKTYPAGTYVVGKDVPEGEYLVTQDSLLMAFYCIFNGAEIAENDAFINRRIVQLEKYQKIQLNHAKMVSILDAPAVDLSNGWLPEGTYRIGAELPAGTYTLSSVARTGEHASYEIDQRGTDNKMQMEDIEQFDGVIKVMVSNGQYLNVTQANIYYDYQTSFT